MIGNFWNKQVNKKQLFTEEQIEEQRQKLKLLERKIASKYEVIEAYNTSPKPNQKRILANQKEIEILEIEKANLLNLIKDMEDNNVNRKKT